MQMEITLRVAGDDIRVLISSYSETAEDENTASVVRAYVCKLVSKHNIASRHPPFIHCGNHGALCVISNASTDLYYYSISPEHYESRVWLCSWFLSTVSLP